MATTAKKNVFVIGHKNPDTDSICSAIALADIKNRTDSSKHYIPRRAGQINSETKYVLDRFGVTAPAYLNDVGTQVKDMEIRKSPNVTRDCSIREAWRIMRENALVTLPVRTDDGALDGIVTMGDIAYTYMESSMNIYMLSEAQTSYGAIAEAIDGKLITGSASDRIKKGKVLIGAADPERITDHIESGDIMIISSLNKVPDAAIEKGAGCLIICLDLDIPESLIAKAKEYGCVIIGSDMDTYTVARRIIQSIPLSYIMKSKNLITFKTEDYTEDIKDIMVQHKHRAFPVINKNGKCIGTISRRNFLGITKKQIILVDHNEIEQAVDNIQAAEILQIVDHHRLGDIQTLQPVLFRLEPVGCTATILYHIYQEEHLDITPHIAGLLCAAIISDTLMFRSPTCTVADKLAAGGLAVIAGINIEAFAAEMFKAGSDLKNKSPEEIFYQDYKRFSSETVNFGVGQISSMSFEELDALKVRMLEFMQNECGHNEVSQVYFMLTDILNESTELLYCGSGCEKMIQDAFGITPKNGSCVLPKIVSRKKQLVPALLDSTQEA
jgi:manganese-dependent inorganic pyrophosphatase